MKVEGECGRESQVDRNLQASTTSKAGKRGNTVFALAVAQRLSQQMNSCNGAHASRNLSPMAGNLEMATGRARSLPARPRRRPRRSRGGYAAL
eukprot:3747818-Pleurochrysis_carterae.AAC.1